MRNHKRTKIQSVILVVLALLLMSLAVGCGGGTGSTGASNLLTADQIAEVALSSLLAQAGQDLEERYSVQSPTNSVSDRYAEYPDAVAQASQELMSGGAWSGGVVVFLYDDQVDIDAAYGEPADDWESIADLGERSKFISFSMPFGTSGGTIDGVDIGFVRCSAVVHMRIIRAGFNTTDADLIAFAVLLDEILAPAVCSGAGD